jgi:acetyl-CoA carboxylase biotin carboxyl carrier protein
VTDPGELSAEDVRRILELVDQSHFGELRLELGDLRIYVRKTGVAPGPAAAEAEAAPEAGGAAGAPAEQSGAAGAPPEPDAGAAAAPEPAAAAEKAPDGRLRYVTAPMVGTFYRAPAPDQPPFVEPGDSVAAGDAVGIIEVMKLFNSITAGVDGTVAEVLAENGAAVEYGQRLVAIEPADGEATP